jgi:hypothetical protein
MEGKGILLPAGMKGGNVDGQAAAVSTSNGNRSAAASRPYVEVNGPRFSRRAHPHLPHLVQHILAGGTDVRGGDLRRSIGVTGCNCLHDLRVVFDPLPQPRR